MSTLLVFKLPEAAPVERSASDQASWQDRLESGFWAALKKLSGYIRINTQREVPYQALMDPQWEAMVRQNLRMLLQQSQIALISGNDLLYQQSLVSTDRWLQEFFNADHAGVEAIRTQLQQLRSQPVGVALPNLSASLRAVKLAVDTREEQGL